MTPFGDLPNPYGLEAQARVIILPVPYDGTSTWVKGSDRGPAALLEASANMELYDIETDSEPYRVGIHTAPAVTVGHSPEAMVEAVRAEALAHIGRGRMLVTLGGEHSVSIGPIQAYAQTTPNLSVLQIDAHTDLRQEYHGSRNNHACVMARARELCPIVQVGIRSMDAAERAHIDPSRVFWAHTMAQGSDEWMARAIGLLTQNVYLTIDLDGLDPSILPSTGTPEPGGLGWYQTLRFLRMLAEQRNVVGFDVVELCPNPHERSSDFVAAKLVYKLLGYIFRPQGQPPAG